MRVMMVRPGFSKGCEAQIGTRIMCKWILTIELIMMSMVGMMVNSVRKWGESFETAPANLEMSSWAKILNALETLDGINVGLEFQSKMLRMW